MPTTIKKLLTAFVMGALMVSSAWAGGSVLPVSHETTTVPDVAAKTSLGTNNYTKERRRHRAAATPATQPGAAPAPTRVPDPSSLKPGQVLAGAAKMSTEPRPGDYGGTWETSREKCETLSENGISQLTTNTQEMVDHLAVAGSPWPENPNCIYMGGFGIGPMNPVSSWDQERGLWVRAIALRDRDGDDLVLAILDGEGYFWDYGHKCDDCGVKQITASLAADESLGLKPENLVVAATHAHSSPDFIGGWGFVPDWYMKQVSDTIKATIRAAMASMRPAVLEAGEHEARPFNSERRGTYRSAEEQHLAWLRAYTPRDKETIATIGAYAAHPTAFGTNGGKASADWPGLFEKSLEDRFGGVGMHFMTGLGNMSNSGLGNPRRSADLANLVGDGTPITNPDIRTTRTTWAQPATNVPLTALGVPGFFDRKFLNSPASVSTGKSASAPCASTSPVSVEVASSAARIGNAFALTASPGEIFSNLSNTIKEKSGATVTMPLGQANDALGYMPQSFELSPVGQQGLGFALDGVAVVNYEDSYSIDRCYGDMALETAIGLLGGLK
ncbi:MAG TPA: hypothetical protein VF549_04420 [Solirubrobacteraceae bacterium]|jgi:hypothetical protein